ncbi:MAG: hypothetical protein JXR88_08350 [Clostridia bacterium]|nr:hypothetical protein [Clostridia bacterium]
MIFKKQPMHAEKKALVLSSIKEVETKQFIMVYEVAGTAIHTLVSAQLEPKGVLMKDEDHVTYLSIDKTIHINELNEKSTELFGCKIEEVL